MSIKPALTPEEWPEVPERRVWVRTIGHGGDEITPIVEGGVVNGYAVATHARHALAARCLHGQPFGFTREDVDALRTMVSAYRKRFGDAELIDRLASLAARIEALLPPEVDPSP